MALPFVLSLLVGCDPHDATVTGKYAMYFSEAVSDNILRLRRNDSTDTVQCNYTQDDPLSEDIDSDQIFKDPCWEDKVAAEAAFQKEFDLEPFDCRYFGGAPHNGNPIRIRDAMIPGWEKDYEEFCCAESRDNDPDNDPDGNILTSKNRDGESEPDSENSDCTPVTGKFMDWLDDRSYYLNHDEVTTWREEALMTSEGDLQLTLHMTTPFGEVRFGWVVDPDFQPTECVDDGEGSKAQALFGDEDVIANWSASEEEGTTLFYMNAGAAQINPNNTGDSWYFEQDWSAAAGFSRFGDEDAYMYSTDYAQYDAAAGAYYPYYVSTDDDGGVTGGYGTYGNEAYEELNCDADGQDGCKKLSDYADFAQMMVDNFNNGGPNGDLENDEDAFMVEPAQNDLENFGKLPQDEFPFQVKIEDNSWRKTEAGRGADASGLDNWVGVNPGWVRFQMDPKDFASIEPGALSSPLKGDFQIYLISAGSTGSVWFFEGSFEINTIQRDTWGYSPELHEIKSEENNTETCGS